MSIAGVLGPLPGASDCVLASLKSLSYENDSGVICEREPLILGVANDSELAQSDSSRVHVAFSGQLFDGDAVARDLDVAGHQISAAQLAALAYQRWGESFPDRLYGEFAFALWDAARGTLLLGTDALGIGAMHYAHINGVFVFASEPRGLMSWPGFNRRLDDETIAQWFTAQITPGRTLFRAIKSVLSGHILRVNQNGEQQLSYWNPLSRPQLKLRDPREYGEALLCALENSVALRIPQTGLVASQLSSGLDSSAVTALLAMALARKNRPLLAYTAVPVRTADAAKIMPNRFGDESALASKLAAKYANIEHILIPTDAAGWWDALDSMADALLAPPGFIRNAMWYHAMHRDAQARGVVTMFGAAAGNLTTSYAGGFGLYDLRRRHQWLSFVQSAIARRHHGASWRQILMTSWMPSPVKIATVKRKLGLDAFAYDDMGMLRRSFYESTGLPPLPTPLVGYRAGDDRSNGRSWRLTIFRHYAHPLLSAGERRLYGMRRADPTFDRRLVELCLAIPDEAFCLGGEPRGLWRHAIAGVVPQEMLAQRGRGLQASDFLDVFGRNLQMFREEVEQQSADPLVPRILDVERMRDMLNAWPGAQFSSTRELDHAYNVTFGFALALGRLIRRVTSAAAG